MVGEILVVAAITIFSAVIIYKNIKNKGNCDCSKCNKECLSRVKEK